MLDNNHECFSPPQANCTLWRYMDFTKLLSLLENEQLLFPRADQFEDPYEGSWSKAGVALIRDPNLNAGLPQHAVDLILSHMDVMRRETFISCWFANEHESAAMWKLYLQSPEGIAIRSDHDALSVALDASPLRTRTSMVNYIDYDQTPIPFGNLFFPFVHKRLSFAHESELRAIIWSNEDINKSQITADATSVSIGVVPQQLIKAVHVSPTAPKWFGQLVEQILKRFGLVCPVVRSSLYERPSY